MIVPPVTNWPAKRLTPSIFGCESRPLREEPCPFLCAMVLSLDAVDAQLDQILTMAVATLGVIAMTLLENDEARSAALADDRCDNRRTGNRRRSDLRLISAEHQNLVERDLVLI